MGPVRREEVIASLSDVAPRDETGFIVAPAVYPVLRQTVEGGISVNRSGGWFPPFGDNVFAAAGGHVSHAITAECVFSFAEYPVASAFVAQVTTSAE